MANRSKEDMPKNEKGLTAKHVIVTAVAVVVAYALGVITPDFFRKDAKIAQDTRVAAVQTAVPAVPAAGTEPAVQLTYAALSPDHQKHVDDIAKKASEAAKTGDYSYLSGEYDAKEEIIKIDVAEAKYLFDSGKAVFVDARGPAEYAQGHVKGAVSVPTTATPAEIAALKDRLSGKVLVTYCHGAGCHLADKTAYKLFESGYKKIAIFYGGWPKWMENKYPVTMK